MRSKNLFRIISGALLITLCLAQAVYSDPQLNVGALHRVKKIFIGVVYNINEEMRIEPFLKNELVKKGFEVVDDPSKADAVLSGEIQAEIVLDGDGSVPNKIIYLYQLTLPNKEVVWKSKVKFVNKPTFAEDNEYAAKRISEKIAKDWQKAVKKAGAK